MPTIVMYLVNIVVPYKEVKIILIKLMNISNGLCAQLFKTFLPSNQTNNEVIWFKKLKIKEQLITEATSGCLVSNTNKLTPTNFLFRQARRYSWSLSSTVNHGQQKKAPRAKARAEGTVEVGRRGFDSWTTRPHS